MSSERRSNVTVYIQNRYLDKVDAMGVRSYVFERAVEKLLSELPCDPEKFKFVKEKVSKKTYTRAILGSISDAIGIVVTYGGKIIDEGIEYKDKVYPIRDNIEQILSILLDDVEATKE